MKQFLHRVLTVVFAAFIFIGAQAFGYGNALQAFADDTVKSPQGIYYKGTPQASVLETETKPVDPAKNTLQSIVDNVREKLNLDEPLPESTKEFLGSTEKRVEKVLEPITGTK